MAELLDRRTAPNTGNDDAANERWALVQRVAASHGFQQARQLREFLLYVAGHALSNETSEINEQKIGCAVLHRREDFNPAEDNIVRVQARRLRDKLADYFATEGRDEPVILEIPKGSYVPEFKPRSAPATESREPSSAAAEPVAGRPTPWRMISAALLVMAVALAAVTIILWRATSETVRPRILPRSEQHPVLSAILSADTPTTIVASDTALITLVGHLNEKVTLHEYLDPGYPENIVNRSSDMQLRRFLLPLANGEYISLTELNVAALLFALGPGYGADIRVRHARQLNIRDFDNGNFVIVGTPVSNPWFDLFSEGFDYEYDIRTHSLRDVTAAANAEQYRTTDNGTFRESYVAVGLLPNLTETGNVLVLNGIAPRAPEAAARLLFAADFASRAKDVSGIEIGVGDVPHFEMLVRVRMVTGVPKSAEIVQIRALTESAAH